MAGNTMANVSIDIIGIILMLIILFNFKKKSSRQSFDQKVFFKTGLWVIATLVIDAVSWAIDGNIELPRMVLNFVNVMLFICGVYMPVVWSVYFDFKLFKDVEGVKKRTFLYAIPAYICTVFCIIQLFTPIIFDFTANNEYYRLTISIIMFITPLLYFVFTEVLIILNKKKLPATAFLPSILYGVFPVLGITIELIFGITAIYISVAFSFLVIFFRVQNDLSVTDYLTNLNNRRHLEDYLKEITSHIKPNETIYGIMYDIDGFKEINDQYGHAAGDRALVDLSDIFVKTVRKTDFISRYAGDEFIIILKMDGKGNIDRVIDDINKAKDRYNRFNTAPFKLDISYGYASYKRGEKVETFLNRLDEEMYFNKNRKKQKKIGIIFR